VFPTRRQDPGTDKWIADVAERPAGKPVQAHVGCPSQAATEVRVLRRFGRLQSIGELVAESLRHLRNDSWALVAEKHGPICQPWDRAAEHLFVIKLVSRQRPDNLRGCGLLPPSITTANYVKGDRDAQGFSG